MNLEVAKIYNPSLHTHAQCLGTGSPTSRSNFVTTPPVTTDDLMAARYPYRWGIWLQYPVLSYLDSVRKRHLLYVISEMAGGGDLFNRICIAEVEQYGVSTYRES